MHEPTVRRRDRETTRYHVALEYQMFMEADDRGGAGTTLDVSETGIRFLSAARVSIGERVVVSLALPTGTDWVDAEGRIARIEEGLREGDEGRTISVEFSKLADGDLAKLILATAHHPEPAPRRDVFRLAERRY